MQGGHQLLAHHRAHHLADAVGGYDPRDAQPVGDLGGQQALAGPADPAQQDHQGARRLPDDPEQPVAGRHLRPHLAAQQFSPPFLRSWATRHQPVLGPAQQPLGVAGHLPRVVGGHPRRQQRLHQDALREECGHAAAAADHAQLAPVAPQEAVGLAQRLAVVFQQGALGQVVDLVGGQRGHALPAQLLIHLGRHVVGPPGVQAQVFQAARQHPARERQHPLVGPHQDVLKGRNLRFQPRAHLLAQQRTGELHHQRLEVGGGGVGLSAPPQPNFQAARHRRRALRAGPGVQQRLGHQPLGEGPVLALVADVERGGLPVQSCSPCSLCSLYSPCSVVSLFSRPALPAWRGSGLARF